jgi:3-keto-disaccharide hydrolase
MRFKNGRFAHGAMVVVMAIGVHVVSAQQPPAAGQGQGQGQGGNRPAGARRPPFPEAIKLDEHEGYTSIFDGTSLKGWDGDTAFWRAENGTLVGETTAANPLKANTFIIWRGGQTKDFELKLEYRMNATNSGVQYRSVEAPEIGKWVLKGYQADIDFNNQWTGQLYEERGRGFLALRGQSTYIGDGVKSRVIGTIGDGEALKALIKSNEWNQVHIIARDNTLIHIVNGQVMSVVVDDDTKARAMSGLLGFQLHMGDPMKVEFRNIWLKTI